MAELDDALAGAEQITDNLENLNGGEEAGEGAGAEHEGAALEGQADEGAEGQEVGAPEGDGQAKQVEAQAAEAPEDDDELEITFGDEAAPARGENSDLVKHLRAQIRERDEKLAAMQKGQPASAAPEVGPEPTLESCEYDSERFKNELFAWRDRKAQADAAQTEAQRQAQAEQERFQQRLQVYAAGKDSLKAKDFDIAEAAVTTALSPVQQAVALKAASDPAKLVYALGRYPQKLAELKALTDPIELAVAVAKLEGQIKVTQRTKTPPAPDRPVLGAAPLSGMKVDRVLEKLEAEAARTGDRTKVVAYKRAQRAKEQK